MIRFLNDETVGGYRYGKGAIARFDAATEAQLMAAVDAENYPRSLLISQAYSPATRTSENSSADTRYVTLASVTVPAGTMNYNGKIVIEQDWKYTNSSSNKTLRVDWGGEWITGPAVSTSARACFMLAIKNANSLRAQTILNSTYFSTSTLDTTASADTTQDVAIEFRCNWAANVASEQITLLGYSIWYYPGND